MVTKVKELMTLDPVRVTGDSSLQEAAQEMESNECGVLPVGSWEKLEGIITDRDIVIRAVAKGKDVHMEKVRDYMTSDVFYCNVEDTLEEAAAQMHEHRVSRLVVKDKVGKACGILTFGCMMRKDADLQEIGRVVESAVGKKAA